MPPDLERLYDDHAQALFAFLLSLTRDETDTRDVLQEIFVKLARQPDLLRSARDERAFLIRLAHNATIDLIRRRGTRSKHHEDETALGVEKLSRSAPLRRIGDDDDLKGAALLFASAAGKHITGQILAVDGGVSAVHSGG